MVLFFKCTTFSRERQLSGPKTHQFKIKPLSITPRDIEKTDHVYVDKTR